MESRPDSPGMSTLLVLELKPFSTFKTKDEYIFAMKEDLAEWFKCLYKIDIGVDNFFDVLDTGVLLCEHSSEVRKIALEKKRMGIISEMKSNFVRDIQVPIYDVQFRKDVKPQTFQARDNISNFIKWTRDLGILEVLQFETDDLVLRKNEKSVILCLLEIARIGAKLGMLAPTIVQMEEEIDAEIAGEPAPQIKTCDLKSLDELVQELAGRCTCPIQFVIMKVGQGKYRIGESQTLVFIRVLRTHVMIRVGGGWDTLEHYLNKHDPCRCDAHGYHRPANQPTSYANSSQKVTSPRRASTPAVSTTPSFSSKTGRKLSLVSARKSADDTCTTPTRMRSSSTGLTSRRNLANSTTVRQLPVAPKDSNNEATKRTITSYPNPNHSSIAPRQRSMSPVPIVKEIQNSGLKNIPGNQRKGSNLAIARKVPAVSRSKSTPPIPRNMMNSSGNDIDDTSDAASGSGRNYSMERISTMTLEEFKNMLNSSLSVPNGHSTGTSSPDSPRSQSSSENRTANRAPICKSKTLTTGGRDTSKSDSSAIQTRRSLDRDFHDRQRRTLPLSSSVVRRPKTPTNATSDSSHPSSGTNVGGANNISKGLSRPLTLALNGNYSKPNVECSQNKVTDDLIKACMDTYRNVEAYKVNIDKLDKEHPFSLEKDGMDYSSDSYVSSPASELSRDSFAKPDTVDVSQRLQKKQPERSSTPSFIPRPFTPSLQKAEVSNKNYSDDRPPIPNRSNAPTPKPRTGCVKESYVGMYQARRGMISSSKDIANRPSSPCRMEQMQRRATTPGSTNITTRPSSPCRVEQLQRRATTPSPRDITNRPSSPSRMDQMQRRATTPGPRDITIRQSSPCPTEPTQHRARTPGPTDTQNSTQLSSRDMLGVPVKFSLKKESDTESHTKSRTLVSTASTMRQNTPITPQRETCNTPLRDSKTTSIVRRCVTPTPIPRKQTSERRPTTPGLIKQKAFDEEPLISINRHEGHHSVTVDGGSLTQNNTKRPSKIIARASRNVDTNKEMRRSRSVDSSAILGKTTAFSAETNSNTGESKTRTEAWVETTTRKPPLRKQRPKTPAELDDSYLESRPLEEIQKALTVPNGVQRIQIKDLPPPPEDPEMFETMNLLFLKLQEKELRESGKTVVPQSNAISTQRLSDSKSSKDSESEDPDLIAEIKQILKVNPRRDSCPGHKTKIPQPASFSSMTRAKSVSNLFTEREELPQRSETPVPKLSVPLTTGRTTFVNGKERSTTPKLFRVKSLDRPLSSLSQSPDAQNFNYSLSYGEDYV